MQFIPSAADALAVSLFHNSQQPAHPACTNKVKAERGIHCRVKNRKLEEVESERPAELSQHLTTAKAKGQAEWSEKTAILKLLCYAKCGIKGRLANVCKVLKSMLYQPSFMPCLCWLLYICVCTMSTLHMCICSMSTTYFSLEMQFQEECSTRQIDMTSLTNGIV